MNGISKPPAAYVKHQLPGRVRLKIPQKRGDFGYFDRMAELLADCATITQLQLNPPAASLLICHAPDRNFSTIAEFAQTQGLFFVTEQQPEAMLLIPPLPIAKLASAGLNRIDESLLEVSQGRLDGRTLLIMALIGLSVRQMSRGNMMGAASSLIWYAFRLLKEESEKAFDLDQLMGSE